MPLGSCRGMYRRYALCSLFPPFHYAFSSSILAAVRIRFDGCMRRLTALYLDHRITQFTTRTSQYIHFSMLTEAGLTTK
jgi:hypothetical protein